LRPLGLVFICLHTGAMSALAYTKKSSDKSYTRRLKKFVRVNLAKGEHDRVFSEEILDMKDTLKDNIHGTAAMLKQMETVQSTAAAYTNALEALQLLVKQVSHRVKVTDHIGGDGLERLCEAERSIVDTISSTSRQYTSFMASLEDAHKDLKSGEHMLRSLRTMMKTKDEYAKEVNSIGSNKHRDRATKKLLLAQQTYQAHAVKVQGQEELAELAIDGANAKLRNVLLQWLTMSIQQQASAGHATLEKIDAVSEDLVQADNATKSEKSRLEEKRTKIESKQTSMSSMQRLATNAADSGEQFRRITNGLVPQAEPVMFPGEAVVMTLHNALYLPIFSGERMGRGSVQIGPTPGSLVVTTYRLLFSAYVPEGEQVLRRGSSGVAKYSMLFPLPSLDEAGATATDQAIKDIKEAATKSRRASEEREGGDKPAAAMARPLVFDDMRLGNAGSDEETGGPRHLFQLPYGAVSRVDVIDKETETMGLWSERLEAFTICLKYASKKKSLEQVLEQIKTFAFGTYLYAMDYRLPPEINLGWGVYESRREYARVGLNDTSNSAWRLSDINASYSMCDTYPQFLIVPKNMTDQDILAVSKYRKKARLPVAVWRLGAVTNSYATLPSVWRREGAGNVTLMRSSQPKATKSSSTRFANLDVKVTELLARTSRSEDGHRFCNVFDARPFINSVANVALGGGFERANVYPDCNVQFLDIENIHAVRESWVRLNGLFSIAQTKNMDNEVTHSYVEGKIRNGMKSYWLHHVSSVITGARAVASSLLSGISALVHCSDGWDRTSQLTSLAQLMLDPYFRTIEGFEVLIEKEWCSFGHKFAARTGQHGYNVSSENYLDKDRSPIFVQFLDCVWQMMSKVPAAFEFNSMLLEVLFFHVYSCRFGTFLFDSEKQRRDQNVYQHTVSIWTDINESKAYFTNENYIEHRQEIMNMIDDDVQLLGLWKAYLDVRRTNE
jgi:hypothetical protein